MSQPRLHTLFPALRRTLPHLPLGAGPTPVRELSALGAEVPVWMKDDSGFGDLWGGNKPRKLEWVLADARRRGRRAILTVGALGTNHGIATARFARSHGMHCVLMLVDQPLDEHVERQLELIRGTGARVYVTHTSLRTALALPWAMARNTRGLRPPYLLGPGGSSPVGTVGFIEAALELGEQVREGALPEPAHVVVALGSGGTAAGLTAGLRLAGLRTRVWPVLVNDKLPLGERGLLRLASRAQRLLAGRGADASWELAPLTLESRFMGDGYGHRTGEGEEAMRLAAEREALELEPVYTAKALAATLALAREGAFGDGPVLYWHTSGSRR
ncbi:MAG TPA: pyridoxal-phosphate dependent enzyme [Thermoleophilaceae bacterium]|nr:pyridoxal-phosphate dependent enzyme [Thermoleophilaceae bacterium]